MGTPIFYTDQLLCFGGISLLAGALITIMVITALFQGLRDNKPEDKSESRARKTRTNQNSAHRQQRQTVQTGETK